MHARKLRNNLFLFILFIFKCYTFPQKTNKIYVNELYRSLQDGQDTFIFVLQPRKIRNFQGKYDYFAIVLWHN